jgi:hypothetical protein
MYTASGNSTGFEQNNNKEIEKHIYSSEQLLSRSISTSFVFLATSPSLSSPSLSSSSTPEWNS